MKSRLQDLALLGHGFPWSLSWSSFQLGLVMLAFYFWGFLCLGWCYFHACQMKTALKKARMGFRRLIRWPGIAIHAPDGQWTIRSALPSIVPGCTPKEGSNYSSQWENSDKLWLEMAWIHFKGKGTSFPEQSISVTSVFNIICIPQTMAGRAHREKSTRTIARSPGMPEATVGARASETFTSFSQHS